MVHDINRMIYVGEMPWHGLGVQLPARASYEEIVQAAGFYEAVEKDVYVPPFRTPNPTSRRWRGDTGEYLSVVGKGYEVVQFAEVARTLVEAAGDGAPECRWRRSSSATRTCASPSTPTATWTSRTYRHRPVLHEHHREGRDCA